MTQRCSLLLVLLLAVSVCAFAQLGDPNIQVGPFGVDCKTFNCSGDPTPIGTTGFTLMSNGAPTADNPWYILLSIPGTGNTDAQGGTDPTAPSITGTGFTISTGADAGDFLPTTSGDIYAFASGFDGGLQGDGSMNATNLFGSAEQAAFGSTPSFFDIFVYTVSAGSLTGNTSFSFTSTLTAGTFVAGLGCQAAGTNPCQQQFSTPFTTAGLVSTSGPGSGPASASGPGPGSGPASASGPGPGGVPEPSGIVLLGSALLAVGAGLRKRLVRA